MKQCSKCGIEKDESQFLKYIRGGKLYTHSYCKKCKIEYATKWFHQLPQERKAEYYSQYWNHRTCEVIKKHHEEMKDDPEHLTTEFIQKIVGRKC